MKLIKRFFKALRFYVSCVGLKNVLFVEFPEFIREAKNEGLSEYSLLSNLVDVMEDSEEAYMM